MEEEACLNSLFSPTLHTSPYERISWLRYSAQYRLYLAFGSQYDTMSSICVYGGSADGKPHLQNVFYISSLLHPQLHLHLHPYLQLLQHLHERLHQHLRQHQHLYLQLPTLPYCWTFIYHMDVKAPTQTPVPGGD